PNPNGVTGIGIGDFSAGNLNAALHVNTNLTVTNTGFSAGEVFRTDGPSGLTHAWRMHSSNISSSLKFSILNLALENYL
ncbi:MAG TPA: hypothetical protein PKJ68_06135, partial [Candidatus Woesebacteria bacterium]|nr:hypothetical protein [Candidatus Woesebacteria bacterium]